MECNYTHLNHKLLVSQKKSGHQGRDYKGGLLYHTPSSLILKIFYQNLSIHQMVPKLRTHGKVFNFHQQ